eukprot:gene28416-31559_t
MVSTWAGAPGSIVNKLTSPSASEVVHVSVCGGAPGSHRNILGGLILGGLTFHPTGNILGGLILGGLTFHPTGNILGGLILGGLTFHPTGPTTALALPPKPSPGYDRLADGLACHSLVVCDLCRSHPIIGVRYRSTSVHDFDVCQACVGTEQALSTGPYQQVGEWVDPRGVLHGLLDTTLEAKLLAKSQLLSGKADDAHWADMYRKAGGDERVDLQLCGDNPHCMEDAGGDLSSPVMLNVMTKNITTLTVKVYELQPWNYFKTCNGRDMDLGIDLEGLGTTMELVVACAAEGQSRMVWNKRRLDLPQLQVNW